MNQRFRVTAGYDGFAVRVNIARALDGRYRGIPWDSVKGGSIAVFGNGPSIRTCDIPKGPIAALNGALGVLLDRGVTPKYAICYDPLAVNARFYERAPKSITYLIASRCDPKIFKALEGRDVRIWHVLDEPELEYAKAGRLSGRAVAGGPSVGLKSLNVLAGIGFDHFDLYGYDSCFSADGKHHASQQEWDDDKRPVTLSVGQRTFLAAPWMAAQAQEAISQFDKNRLVYSVTVHGDGLLKALLDESTLQVCYDLQYQPPTWNFIEWLMNVDMVRRAKGMARLHVTFRPGMDNGFRPNEVAPVPLSEKWTMLENVCRPLIRMFGAYEGGDGRHRLDVPYVLRPSVDAFKEKGELSEFAPCRSAILWAEKYVGGEPVHVITLRESKYWPSRNSNTEAWLEFAHSLKERVIFVRETSKADEDLDGFETCPEASRDVNKRCALYRKAKMNYFVSNGPASLATLSRTTPYINFMKSPPDYPCNTPEWLSKYQGLQYGGQYPWAGPNQRFIWGDDTLGAITAAYKETL